MPKFKIVPSLNIEEAYSSNLFKHQHKGIMPEIRLAGILNSECNLHFQI
jgi:hypothetical protein